ncbi:hypothetical protein OQA88_2677 [Cercophora sp. LCS_1]
MDNSSIHIQLSVCQNDGSIGPAVIGCRDDFDFTKTFEQSFLSIAPSSLFILAALARVTDLTRRPALVTGARQLQVLKLAAITALAALQVALIILIGQSPNHQQTGVPAASLGLCALVVFLVLSTLEHSRSLRPSPILNAYLFFSLLFDAAQARTDWLSAPNSPVTKIFTASLGIKAALLLLEAHEKTRWISSAEEKIQSPEAFSNIFNQGFFYWLNDLLFRGYRKPLSIDDLYTLDEKLGASQTRDEFWNKLEHEQSDNKSGNPLLSALVTSLGRTLLAPIIPRIALGCFAFSQPFLIHSVLDYLQTSNSNPNHGYGLIGAAALVYTGLTVSTSFYWYFQERAIARLRSCLVTAIYRKTITNKATNDGSSAITLMNSDVVRVQGGLHDLHECWISVIETAIAAWLLQRQIGVAFVAPLAVVLICAGLAFAMSHLSAKRQGEWMTRIQDRVELASAVVPRLPAIKMSGFAQKVGRLMQGERLKEIASAKRFRVLTTVSSVIAFTPILLSPVVTFTFAEGLNISKAFTSLAFIHLLCQPMIQILQIVPQLLAAWTCFGRIQSYLSSGSSTEAQINSEDTVDERADKPSDLLVVRGGKCGWKKDAWILEGVDLNVRPGMLTLIVGGVASGKSTFCKALIGEVPKSMGIHRLQEKHVRVAYCDQDPFLLNSTIRQNVLGFSHFNAPWYEMVIEACQLKRDLGQLRDGDQTVVGSRGISLSGGQRKRIALARAIYSRPQIAILDDVLGGLDSRTQNLVLRDVFGPEGIFRQLNTAVIITSQSLHHHQSMDSVVILRDKRVLYQGKVDDMPNSDSILSALQVQPSSGDDPSTAEFTAKPPVSESPVAPLAEHKREGLGNMKYYFAATGATSILPFAIFGLIVAFLWNFGAVWLERWASSSQRGEGKGPFFVGVYFALQIVCLVTLGVYFIYEGLFMAPRGSAQIHLQTITTLIRAPLRYYTTVDSAVPVGYLAQDMTIVDNEVPGGLANVVVTGLVVVGQVVVIGAASPWILVGYPVILVVLLGVVKVFLRTSTRLRVLILETKEPLFKHFQETLDGLLTIRAFGWVDANIELNAKILDESQRPSYFLPVLQQWLNTALNTTVAVIAVAFVALATQLKTSAGFSGVALVSLMSLGEMTGHLIRLYAVLQTSTGALSRLRGFDSTTHGEDEGRERVVPEESWPQGAEINVESVSASYQAEDESTPTEEASSALRDVSLHIESGKKVLICGRTGSGKSSLLSLLHGTLTPSSGAISIDGIHINSVPRPTLRNRIIALPQTPFFLPQGRTVRENLEYQDEDAEFGPSTVDLPSNSGSQNETLKTALESVGMWTHFETQGGLDAELREDGLSHGQKQLLSLARAVVRVRTAGKRRGGIVLLDEFNTGLDEEVEGKMLRVVMSEFKDFTVICVAHKLGTLDGVDMVVVMGEGKVLETGRPEELMGRGHFGRLWAGSGR